MKKLIMALAALALSCGPVLAQDAPLSAQRPPVAAPTVHIQSSALPALDNAPQFDAARATDRYLARVSGTARQRSDAYADGGYWLQLVGLLYGLLIVGVWLGLGLSTRLRDWTEGRTHSRSGQVMLYAGGYVALTTLMALPLSLYEGFFREHAYGLSHQDILGWAGDFGTGFLLTLAAAVILLPILYAVIRAAREHWYLWGGGLAILCLIVQVVVYPVFVAPLFNHYTPLPDSPLQHRILSLARANTVPADAVYVADTSRQTDRISANVSGMLGTTRIVLTDNLLKQASPDEVLAVVGHEMGHYVMGHTLRGILLYGLVILLGFAFTALAFRVATDFFGGHWQVREVEDVAGLPLLVALASIFLFVMTPVTNTISRTMEQQADIFGLNTVRQPDAFASVILKLSPYRKLDPGPLEEAVFFDHPSGRSRIEDAMRWKLEHFRDPDIIAGPQSPQ